MAKLNCLAQKDYLRRFQARIADRSVRPVRGPQLWNPSEVSNRLSQQQAARAVAIGDHGTMVRDQSKDKRVSTEARSSFTSSLNRGYRCHSVSERAAHKEANPPSAAIDRDAGEFKPLL